MSPKRWIAAATAALLISTIAALPAAADPISEQKARVRAAEARVQALQMRLGDLLKQLQALRREMDSNYSQLHRSDMQLKKLEERAEQTRAAFVKRARFAYMHSASDHLRFFLRARTLSQFISSRRIFSESMKVDLMAYEEFVAAKTDVVEQKDNAELTKTELLAASKKIDAVKAEITQALQSEADELGSARVELGRLEAAKRDAEMRARIEAQKRLRGTLLSPEVEARRSARQALLDKKLAELLGWYAPGLGPEPYMPPMLEGTGIRTNGMTSWYGPGFDRRRASSGATYREEQLTAASLILPFGTLLKVSYSGRAVVVVITDRGPYVEGRVLDLSRGAADALGVRGVKRVDMEILVPRSTAPPFP